MFTTVRISTGSTADDVVGTVWLLANPTTEDIVRTHKLVAFLAPLCVLLTRETPAFNALFEVVREETVTAHCTLLGVFLTANLPSDLCLMMMVAAEGPLTK